MEWVSVKDNLPKPGQRVRARANIGLIEEVVFITTSDGDYFWDNGLSNVWQSYEIKEWQPLPDPPKS